MSDIADLGTLCRALGFLAVAMKEENLRAGSGRKAEKLAQLIEQFCVLSEDEATDGYATTPAGAGLWSCEHSDGISVIRTPAAPGGEMGGKGGGNSFGGNVIELRGATEAGTRAAAEHIIRAVNDNSRKDALIAEMSACLEICLQSTQLGWDAEHDADILINRAKKIRG